MECSNSTTIVIENNNGNTRDAFEIDAKDFIACGDGVLAIRDSRNMNILVLGPEEWSKAYYKGMVLRRVTVNKANGA